MQKNKNNSVIQNFRITETEFEKYRIIQDRLFESDFDRIINLQLPTQNDKA